MTEEMVDEEIVEVNTKIEKFDAELGGNRFLHGNFTITSMRESYIILTF